MSESLPQPEKREDPDIEKYLDIIIARGNLARRPDLADFEDIWGKEKIEQDMEYVEKRRGNMEKYDDVVEKRGEALEILATYYIENMDWLGEGAHASMTSEYDDIAHGIDMVTEFEPGDDEEEVKRLGLAIDAYSGKSIANFAKKAERFVGAVRGEIDPGTSRPYTDTVARVDYFQSRIKDKEGEAYRGGLSKLPPVAVSVSGLSASELFRTGGQIMESENAAGQLTLKKQKGESLTPVEEEMLQKHMDRLRKLKPEAKDNPVKKLFIKQIKMQLEAYIEIGEESEEADPEFLDNIKRDYEIIKALDSENEDLGDLQEDLDRVEEIFNKLKNNGK